MRARDVLSVVCRGWGVRTLCDIPAGSFITTYSGQLLTEAAANQVTRATVGLMMTSVQRMLQALLSGFTR